MVVNIRPLDWYDTAKGRAVKADTPFGSYYAWRDGAMWVPQHIEYSQHGSIEAAQEAARKHLEESITSLLGNQEQVE